MEVVGSIPTRSTDVLIKICAGSSIGQSSGLIIRWLRVQVLPGLLINKPVRQQSKMTRINVGVEPSELSKEHLLAEHREIKRIPNAIRTGRAKLDGSFPTTFRLGQGHVRFFYNKLGYLLKRYLRIYEVCRERQYNITDYSGAWDGIPQELMGDYEPTESDRCLVLQRMRENESRGS